MNNDRRKILNDIVKEIAKLDLSSLAETIADLHSRLETAKDDEQSTYDNMPESLQNGERGEKATTAIDAMECASNALESIKSSLEAATNEIEEVTSSLEEAAQ